MARSLDQLYDNANTIDIDLGTLRKKDDAAVAVVWDRVQSLTRKRLTQTYPSVPRADLAGRWAELRALLDELR